MWIEMEKLQEVLSVENLICLAFLLGISVYDIYFHGISKAVLVLANLLAAFHTLYTLTMAEGRLGRADEMDLIWAAAGAGAGLLLLGVARLTGEAVGYGDGWLVMALGIYLGLWGLMEVLAAAWVLLAAAAAVCLVKKKWSRKAVLPMTPFLTAGFVILLAGEYFRA